MLWFEQQSERGSKVMVFPWGLEMVCHRQIMHCPATRVDSHFPGKAPARKGFLLATSLACNSLNNILLAINLEHAM